MKISDAARKLLVKEIKYVVGEMNKKPSTEEKIYFFSGVHSAIQRLFNMEYDPDLIFLHFILSAAHQAFVGRLQAIKSGEMLIGLDDDCIKKLTETTKELGRNIEKDEDISDIAKKFTILAYTTTGNGNYLRLKGVLNLKDL
jgi:hypothetical protein